MWLIPIRASCPPRLRFQGFEVHGFANSNAVEKMVQSVQPDILISSLVISENESLHLASRIIRLSPGCRVLLTASNDLEAAMFRGVAGRDHSLELFHNPFTQVPSSQGSNVPPEAVSLVASDLE